MSPSEEWVLVEASWIQLVSLGPGHGRRRGEEARDGAARVWASGAVLPGFPPPAGTPCPALA